jgi:acyl carrier protein
VSLPEGAAPTKEQVFDEVRAVMKGELGLSVEALVPDAHLVEDLDLDSIDLVDLAATLEERLGLSFRTEELASVRLIQDVVDLIHGALVERNGKGR